MNTSVSTCLCWFCSVCSQITFSIKKSTERSCSAFALQRPLNQDLEKNSLPRLTLPCSPQLNRFHAYPHLCQSGEFRQYRVRGYANCPSSIETVPRLGSRTRGWRCSAKILNNKAKKLKNIRAGKLHQSSVQGFHW